MAQAPQAPIDQEKADPDHQHSTFRTPPRTSHQPTTIPTTTPITLHHGRDLFQCALHAAVSWAPTSSDLLVIKLHFLQPSRPRSTSQSMTTGAPASSPRARDATPSLAKAVAPFVTFMKTEKNFHQQIVSSSFEWTKILQFDQYLRLSYLCLSTLCSLFPGTTM